MKTPLHDPKTLLENSGFEAAMNQARAVVEQSIGGMSSISGLTATLANVSAPGIKALAGNINNAMETARRTLPTTSTLKELRQVFQRAGVSGGDMRTDKLMHKPASLDHFKANDADRLAKLGLFIGGAPQAPGISEARRTATATEAIKKGIDKLNVVLAGNNTKTGFMPVYAE